MRCSKLLSKNLFRWIFMKIEQAYSLDTNEIIDPELAYDYFWAGIIKDKRNFECPAENCNAPITCANLDKLRQEMKLDPYYKAVDQDEHSIDCELVREYEAKQINVHAKNENQNPRGTKGSSVSDIFEFSRPKSHTEKLENNGHNNLPLSLEERKQKKRNQSSNLVNRASRYYAIRALVSKFLKYKEADTLDQHSINIKNYDVLYKDFFVEINGQELTKLSKYPRIYFGKAFINNRKEKDYAAKFGNKLFFEGNSFNPSTYLSEDIIENAFTKRLYREKFEVLSDKNYPSTWVFIYGIPKPIQFNEKTYINISISNMDFFDMREEV